MMGVEKPDPGAQPVKVKLDPDGPQTLQHFDFVDSDEEYAGMRKMRNRLTGQGSNRHTTSNTHATTTTTTNSLSVTSTAIASSSNTSCSSIQLKKMKCKHSITKAGHSSAADKRPYDLPSSRKILSRGHSSNKIDAPKDVDPEDGQILTPQPDTAATPSPLKDPHVSCGLGSADVSESTFRPSLLDEVLSEKKLLLMRSPSVVKFFKRHQSLLAKRSSNILQLGTHNLMDKPPGKS